MPGAGLGFVNNGSVILRDDIGSVLDPYREVLSRNGFIAGRIAPIMPVQKQAGEFLKKPIAAFLKRIDTRRMEDGTLRRIHVSIASGTYFVRPYGIEYPVDEWNHAVYASDWDMILDGVEEMRDAMARDHEIAVAELVQQEDQYLEDDWRHLVAKIPWNNPQASILDDVEHLRQRNERRMIPPNVMICSDRVYRQFTRNHQILARINSEGAGTQSLPGQILRSQLCDLFHVDEILVGKGIYDDDNETTADAKVDLPTLKRIWKDENVLFGRVVPAGQRPSLRIPSYAYTLQWRRGPGGRGTQIDQYLEPQRQGWVIRARTNYEIQVFGNMTYSMIKNTFDPTLAYN